MRSFAYVMLAFMACGHCATAATNSVSPMNIAATLSTNNIHIGDLAVLKVHVDHPEGARVLLPDFGREKRVITRDQKSQPSKTGGTDFLVTLTSFTPGSHLVSTGLVTLSLADNKTITSPFPDVTLRVQSLITDTNQPLAGLKAPVMWKRPLPWHLMWIIPSVIALAILIAWLISYLRKRAAMPAPRPPPIPPHEKALRALHGLLAKQWIEQENIEPFYVELSGIARHYIEDRFDLRAPEQTTEEFIRTTANSPVLSADHRQLTSSFLEQCDLVKFAKHRPGADDMRAAYSAAERLVQETIPPPPPPTAGAKP